MRTPIILTYISGLAKDVEHTDLKKVTIEDVPVLLRLPHSNSIGLIEDAYGRAPDGDPFTSRKEAEEWLKSWVGKEITKLQDKVREYAEGLQVALGKDVESIDDGVE
jgi:hypothetical protein